VKNKIMVLKSIMAIKTPRAMSEVKLFNGHDTRRMKMPNINVTQDANVKLTGKSP
jgi:hypothetical protein